MELKHQINVNFSKVSTLLIVPYGIETRSAQMKPVQLLQLLIVPYGIET